MTKLTEKQAAMITRIGNLDTDKDSGVCVKLVATTTGEKSIIRNLEKKGLIEIIPGATGKEICAVYLTIAGKEAIADPTPPPSDEAVACPNDAGSREAESCEATTQAAPEGNVDAQEPASEPKPMARIMRRDNPAEWDRQRTILEALNTDYTTPRHRAYVDEYNDAIDKAFFAEWCARRIRHHKPEATVDATEATSEPKPIEAEPNPFDEVEFAPVSPDEERRTRIREAANRSWAQNKPAFEMLNASEEYEAKVAPERSPERTHTHIPIDLYDNSYHGPRWRYALRNRPSGPGCQPKGFIYLADREHPKYRHGTLDYPRELTEKEVYDYELTFIEAIPAKQLYSNTVI